MNAIDQLCLNCGLCCDSALFADVELRSGDDPARLAQLGLTIAKKSPRKLAFAQPCACFDGKYCKIYRDRPRQCHLFECGLLKKVSGGKMKVETAMKTISKAKMLATSVRALLQAFGQCPQQQAMTRCYSQAMSSPIDFSRPGNFMERHGKLMRAFGRFMKLLEKEFLR
jgi:uncharacterized protein